MISLVCAVSSAPTNYCYRFASYLVRTHRSTNSTILEAARATISSPVLFKPTNIADALFVDATMGCSNPMKEALRDIQDSYGETVEIGGVVTIGTGKMDALTASTKATKRSGLLPLFYSLSVDSERVNEDFQHRFKNLAIYFRFNVDRGLETLKFDEWKNTGLVRGHTDAYLRGEHIVSLMDGAMKALCREGKKPTIGELSKSSRYLSHTRLKCSIDSPVLLDILIKPRPSGTPYFIGRESILKRLYEQHFLEGVNRTGQLPAISVLSGMGGAGKTQIALKFAQEYEKRCVILMISH